MPSYKGVFSMCAKTKKRQTFGSILKRMEKAPVHSNSKAVKKVEHQKDDDEWETGEVVLFSQCNNCRTWSLRRNKDGDKERELELKFQLRKSWKRLSRCVTIIYFTFL
jgi:hypothetical protein